MSDSFLYFLRGKSYVCLKALGFIVHTYLPGQTPTLQASLCVVSPTQVAPPWAGFGLLHSRDLLLWPSHDLLQAVQVDHADQFPSTSTYKKKRKERKKGRKGKKEMRKRIRTSKKRSDMTISRVFFYPALDSWEIQRGKTKPKWYALTTLQYMISCHCNAMICCQRKF